MSDSLTLPSHSLSHPFSFMITSHTYLSFMRTHAPSPHHFFRLELAKVLLSGFVSSPLISTGSNLCCTRCGYGIDESKRYFSDILCFPAICLYSFLLSCPPPPPYLLYLSAPTQLHGGVNSISSTYPPDRVLPVFFSIIRRLACQLSS